MRPAKQLAIVLAATKSEAFSNYGLDADISSTPFTTDLMEESKLMTSHARRTLISTILVLSAVFAAEESAKADQPPDHHGRITIENIWITPAKAGDLSILRLRIINEGYDHARLLGVETAITKDTRIVGRISDHESTTFDSIGVRADSDFDLTTDHMWIELGPLVRTVMLGESIPLELIFVRNRVRVDAHVHGAEG